MNLKLKIRQSPIHLLHTESVTSELTMESLLLGFMKRQTTSIFHFCAAIFFRHLQSKSYYVSTLSVMLEPVANIKTLLIEGSCSPINCFHRVIAKQSLCQQLKSSMGDIVTSLILTMWLFLHLFQINGLSRSVVRLSNTNFYFRCLIPRIHRHGGCVIIGS